MFVQRRNIKKIEKKSCLEENSQMQNIGKCEKRIANIMKLIYIKNSFEMQTYFHKL